MGAANIKIKLPTPIPASLLHQKCLIIVVQVSQNKQTNKKKIYIYKFVRILRNIKFSTQQTGMKISHLG